MKNCYVLIGLIVTLSACESEKVSPSAETRVVESVKTYDDYKVVDAEYDCYEERNGKYVPGPCPFPDKPK